MIPYYGAYLSAYGPKETLRLSEEVRRFLLEELCLRLDVKRFLIRYLRIEMELNAEGNLIGACPWCRYTHCFHLDKRSGECACHNCGKESELLSLVCERKGERDMTSALHFLIGCIKMEEGIRWGAERRGEEVSL